MTEEEKEIVKEYKRVIANSYGFAKYDDFVSNLIKYKTEGTIQNTIVDMVNLIEKLQKEIEEKTTIILVGAEKVKSLEKENEEYKKRLTPTPEHPVPVEYQASVFVDKRNYIPKDKIREKIKQLENKREQLGIFKSGIYVNGIYKISLIIAAYKKLLEEE